MNATMSHKLQLAKERLSALGGVAQERGQEILVYLRRWLGALAARMGTLALAAATLVWISWYLFPAATVAGGGEVIASFSFRTLLGTNLVDQSSLLDPGHARTLLRFLGFLAIVAPFAAPLAVVAIGWVVIHENVASSLGQLGADNPFAFKWGFYLLLMACLVLALSALKKRAP